MIFARDKSQMCNNLLQYAHVYAWGREHGRKVISMRFSYKYQYFHICHTSLTGLRMVSPGEVSGGSQDSADGQFQACRLRP